MSEEIKVLTTSIISLKRKITTISNTQPMKREKYFFKLNRLEKELKEVLKSNE